jgi:hypothetical protein
LREIKNGHIVTDAIRLDYTNKIGQDERVSIALWIIDREEKRDIIDVSSARYMSLSDYGEEYREKLREEHNLNTPVFAVLVLGSGSDMSNVPMKETPIYRMAQSLSDANRNIDVYYSIVPADRPMERKLIKVEK